ncbi:MAG: alpha/beta fold hydrolase [Desulfosarcinaceae bacterium]|nr:alpha/beta fold hydrolase [Desulfosarcinaceae bacterium]
MENQVEAHPQLDAPEVRAVLFHPRREPPNWRPPQGSSDQRIPVADTIAIGARFHLAGRGSPNLLFFHGNGEIVADYDDIGTAYRQAGINFLIVDYRGYGCSDGEPTATALLADSRRVLTWIREWLHSTGHTGPLAVMGRSLGSAAALELASCQPAAMDALIIESGFAHTGPLLATLGVSQAFLSLRTGEGFRQLTKIRAYAGPTLVIHAERDHLIPLREGQALFDASPASDKTLCIIPEANHNDIFMRAWPAYLSAVAKRLGLPNSAS